MDVAQIKVDLLERKAELEARQERTHKHIYHKDEPVSPNFNEQIKETENDDLVVALEHEALEEITQINTALQRIVDGNYQKCAHCGGSIGEDRLAAIPYTDSCIDCAN